MVDYTKPTPKREKSVKTALDKWLDAEKAKVDRLRDRKVVGGKAVEEDGEVKKVDPPKEEETIDVLKK